MEPTAVRADPILDNRPGAGSGSQRLVYLLLLGLGMILLGLGAYVRALEKLSWVPEVCIAAGVAVAAPGILSYLYRKYMLEDIKLELQKPALEFKDAALQMMDEALTEVSDVYRAELDLLRSARAAGIYGVFISRTDAIRAFIPFLEDEKHEIVIVGSSLKGLLQEYGPEYEHARHVLHRRRKDGVRIRVLLTHPIVADFRAKQEGRYFEDIGREIIESLEALQGPAWNLQASDIRLYVGTPTCFGIKTADAMLLNTYPYMKEAFASPCLIVRKPGYMYEHFSSSHFRAWNSDMSVAMPNPPSAMHERLDGYAGQINALLDSVFRRGDRSRSENVTST